jgi:hypothetical protein
MDVGTLHAKGINGRETIRSRDVPVDLQIQGQGINPCVRYIAKTMPLESWGRASGRLKAHRRLIVIGSISSRYDDEVCASG